ncbi:MAG: amidase [Pirellulales bacterium]
MNANEICFLSATELVAKLRSKAMSARQVMQAHLDQVERLNPVVNAIVTLVADQALDAAAKADERLARGEDIGPLHGLPVAHKDLFQTKGIRTTLGSMLFADHIPEHDDIIVERLKQAGAISIGKTNTPEFGAGSQTYNELFGRTLNPYDLTKTCGGSSGGAAVALACGMIPIADGSDLGGSLRNPASFCNVVGLRPSTGRVPVLSEEAAWFSLSVHGPMARTVEDAALVLSAIAGPDDRAPIAVREPGTLFSQPLDRDFNGVRVALSPDLGVLPVDPVVAAVVEQSRAAFESLACIVEDGAPDFTGADEAFRTWRAWRSQLRLGEQHQNNPGAIKPELAEEIERGQQLTGPQLGRASRARSLLYHNVRRFMESYDFLVSPVSQIPPFDVENNYVKQINGTEMSDYIEWMKSCYYISATGLPAISVPCTFTTDGLPVGIQIVGRHQDDLGVLQLAHAFQQATASWRPDRTATCEHMLELAKTNTS